VHNQTNDYVTLAELRPGFGSIGLQLGYRKSDSLNNLLQKDTGDILLRDVEKELVTHGSGIQILLASYNPIDAELLSKIDQIETIAKHLPRISKGTIIDMGAGLTDINKRILPLCTQILVVVEPLPATIIQTIALINNLKELGVAEHSIIPVLVNRIRLEITVPNSQVQQDLGIQLGGVIMPAPELAVQAASRNEPIVIYQPDSITTRQFQKLAETVINNW